MRRWPGSGRGPTDSGGGWIERRRRRRLSFVLIALLSLLTATLAVIASWPHELGGESQVEALIVDLPPEAEKGAGAAGFGLARMAGVSPAAGGPPLILDSALFEFTPRGFVPRVAPDGRRSREVYRRRAAPVRGPSVAILLFDIGLDEETSKLAMSLPEPITMVVSPYAEPNAGWFRAARWAGHETLLEFPTRPARFPIDDAGPFALSPEKPSIARLEALLSRGVGYLGLAAEAGSFAEQPDAFAPIAEALANRGLALVEIASSALEPVARRFGLPYLSVRRAIDRDPSVDAIDEALAALEARAKADGSAIGYGRPLPVTVDRLRHWSVGLAARGLSLAPVGEILAGEPSAQTVSP